MATDAAPVDVSTTIDRALWVALLARTPPPQPAPAKRTVFLGIALDETVKPDLFDLLALPAPGSPGTRTALPAAMLTADPPDPVGAVERPATHAAASRPDFVLLELLGDTSRGMTTTGVAAGAARARAVARSDLPGRARLDEPAAAGRSRARGPGGGLPRVRRPEDENDAIHGVRWVGVNAVAAVHRTAGAELLGTGTGEPGQTYRLAAPGGGGQRPAGGGGGRRLAGLDRGRHLRHRRADDRHYTVDPTAGLVFGTRTRLPQIGERIRVVAYRHAAVPPETCSPARSPRRPGWPASR